MALPPPALLSSEELAARAVEDRLRAVAGRYSPELRERVQRLLVAAAEAIFKLADLDLVRYESGAEARTSHSIAVWEELAPVMAATVESTNVLIDIATEAFPAPPDVDPLDNLDEAFGPSASDKEPVVEVPPTDEAELSALVAAVSGGLRGDVARLGERLRNPAVMADPWHLISDLLEFRGRLRSGIGELIFEVASRVGEDERALIVPGYQNDLDAAVLVRAATTNLAFLFRGHNRRISVATDDKIQAALSDALNDLASFARTRSLTAMRTDDKRIFIESREHLRSLSNDPKAAREIRQSIEGLAKYLDSLSVVSRRDNLRLHDRSALAGAGRLVETAIAAVREGDFNRARQQIGGAVRAAWSLYGRDPQLDSWLRAQRHFPVEWLADGELSREAERLAEHLGGIAVA